MPCTILLYTTRHPTLTPTAFRTHYETIHIPLLQSIAGAHFPKTHSRRYIQRSDDAPHDATVLVGEQADFGYDAIAELTFEDEEKFGSFMGLVGEESARRRIESDEEVFLERGRTRCVRGGECAVTEGMGV